MAAVWMRAAAELRGRWRAWMVIALMIAIASAVVMTAVAGGRRSDNAVARFLEYTQASDVDVEADPSSFRTIAALPEVESANAAAFMVAGARGEGSDGAPSLSTIALTDPRLTGGPAVVVAGRMFHLDRPGEAVTNETAIRTGLLRIGQRVTLKGFSFDQLDTVLRGSTIEPTGPTATVTIVGALRLPTDLTTTNPPRGVLYTGSSGIFLTPALYRQIGAATAHFDGLSVRLKRGQAGVAAFSSALARVTNKRGVVHLGSDDLQAGAEAQRATHTEAIALWLFGVFGGIAALLVIGQTISRQIVLAARDNQALLALGMSRGRLAAAALIEVSSVAIVGAIAGVALAIGLSPLTPIGLSRLAEVDPGFHVDLPVLLLGGIATIVVVLARSVFPAWLVAGATSSGRSERHPSRTADVFARSGMPASSVAGVQMALDPGYGQNAVPVRSAVAGSIVAVAVLIGSLAFGASLTRLGQSPGAQGWRWDATVGNPHSDDVSARAIPLLRANPNVAAISSLMKGGIGIDGHAIGAALGIARIEGDIGPPILEGRAPRGPDEIALGTKALKAIHKKVGDQVRVSSAMAKPEAERTLKVVGRVLVDPIIANGEITLGDGALMEQSGLRQFVPPQEEDGMVNVFLVRFRAGANRSAALASLRKDFPGTVLTPYAPAEIENLRRIDSLPFVLAALLGVLAATTIAHALVTSVRRRRHDLAVLKTLGFIRGQISATVAWQASTLAVIAAFIGVAAGVAGGRWLWLIFANRLGVHPEPVVPLVVLLVALPGAVLLSNLIAAAPARSASRTAPALVLRSE